MEFKTEFKTNDINEGKQGDKIAKLVTKIENDLYKIQDMMLKDKWEDIKDFNESFSVVMDEIQEYADKVYDDENE